MKNFYNKISDFLSIKKVLVISTIISAILLIPILLLSGVNRATGDDLGYSYAVRMAWNNSHSLIDVLKSSFSTIDLFYRTWQGTWFDIFLFTIQPECFGSKGYIIVPTLSLVAWIGSTAFLFKVIYEKIFSMQKYQAWTISVLFSILCVEFIPGTKSSIFWYNGCAHYIYPFAICQIAIALLIKYLKKPNYKSLIGLSILATLIGGANYQVCLLLLLSIIFSGAYIWIINSNKRKSALLLLIPTVLESIGLLISVKAPGNKFRGGSDFNFSVGKFVSTIQKSFSQGFIDGKRYICENPIQVIGMIVLFVILTEFFLDQRKNTVAHFVKYPVLVSVSLILVYVAMEAPLLYANVDDASQGCNNTNYQVFYLMLLGIETLLAQRIGKLISSKEQASSFHRHFFLPALMVFLIVVVVFKGNLKASTSYECYDYIVSGQAQDFKTQMLQYDQILSTDDPNPVVPFINDVQGPLMHMPVTADPERWTNRVTAQYYGKDSIVAIDRDEWNRLYG